MERAGTAAGSIVKQRAAGLAPVDTGALARSIRAEAHGAEVTIGAYVPYAGFMEYGTVYVPASPYLRPALEAATAQIVEEYRQDVETILEKVEGT
jgi:HK97 gp10 family phage protein